MRATILITTKNRKEELLRAVRSALLQNVPVEVLVIDDGSTDGTAQMMAEHFPQATHPNVKFHRFEESGGYIGRRNQGAQLASTPYVFSIDDDAAFSTPNIVEQTLANFDHPRIGAVAIPYINVNQDKTVHQLVPGTGERYVAASFVGTAHALRRELFLALGGYCAELIHQGEEEDFCARLYDAGYVVRIGTADPIHHYESPNRNWGRMTYYGQRNNLLNAWQNVPMPSVLLHMPGTSVKGLLFGLKVKRFWLTVKGQSAGIGGILAGRFPRKPVSREVYRLLRQLRKSGPQPLSQVEPCLNPLQQPAAG